MLTYLRRLVDERTTLSEQQCRMAELASAEERDFNEGESAALAGIETRCHEHRQAAPAVQRASRVDAGVRRPADEAGDDAGADGHHQRCRVPPPGRPARTDDVGPGVRRVRAVPHLQRARPVRPVRARELPGSAGTDHDSEPVRPPLRAPTRRVHDQGTTARDRRPRHGLVSGVVDWVEVGGDPTAAVVPEGTAKPEAAFTVTPRSAALDTIAHWVQITRQALEDASYIRSLIENKLRRGLLNKAETDMAAALVAATLPAATGADLLTAIRVGIGKVEAAGFTPNAVALNPADYAALDVSVMGATVGGPVQQQTFWGLRAVAVGAIAAGTAYVGDFSTGATLFDRGVTNVFLSDSHASLFISNILVILAEARLKSAVTEPLALCECTETP